MVTRSNRIGRFSIHLPDIRDANIAVNRIMSQCVIVRAEVLYTSNCIEYDAICWRFRECAEGEAVPWYVWYYDEETDRLWPEERGNDQ